MQEAFLKIFSSVWTAEIPYKLDKKLYWIVAILTQYTWPLLLNMVFDNINIYAPAFFLNMFFSYSFFCTFQVCHVTTLLSMGGPHYQPGSLEYLWVTNYPVRISLLPNSLDYLLKSLQPRKNLSLTMHWRNWDRTGMEKSMMDSLWKQLQWPQMTAQ